MLTPIRKAAILGIGVDMLYLPRLRGLITRQVSRLRASPTEAFAIATDRFTRRFLHEREKNDFRSYFPVAPQSQAKDNEEEMLRWLAVRWTAKEAAFKAVYPGFVGTWHDAYIQKAKGLKPSLILTPQVLQRWKEETDCPPPQFHLSISHDGDYVTAFVIAEREG